MSQTVRRAIDIIEFTSAAPRSVNEVADLLGVHRSTALRLLQDLTGGGLVRRRQDGRYGVGYRLAGLAQLALEQFDLLSVAHEYLVSLAESSGHTVHLAALEGDNIIYVDKVDPVGGVRLYSQVGEPVILHTAAVSKAILSQQPVEKVMAILRRCEFQRFTDTTITSHATFLNELDVSRTRGWAVDDGELEDFVNCIAVPVHSATGEVFVAVSITALKAKADLRKLEMKLLAELSLTCASISKELGWKSSLSGL